MSSAEGMVGTIGGAPSIAPWDEWGREWEEWVEDEEEHTDAEREWAWTWCACGRKSRGREEGIMWTAPLTEAMALDDACVSQSSEKS